MSRRQLGDKAIGLGGGGEDEAPDKISVTYNQYKAQQIADGLREAADIVHGNYRPSLILWSAAERHNFPDEMMSEGNVGAVLSQHGITRRTLDKYLDSHIRGGDAMYEFMQEIDEAMLLDNQRSMNEAPDPTSYVGLTMPFESFANMNYSAAKDG